MQVLTYNSNAHAAWLDSFDKNEPPIRIKISHISRVAAIARALASSLNLSDLDVDLAEFIGNHHDDGRFLQWRDYQSFNDNETSLGHAELSVHHLFDEHAIFTYLPPNANPGIIDAFPLIRRAILTPTSTSSRPKTSAPISNVSSFVTPTSSTS